MNPHYNDTQVTEYVQSRNIAPGTLLWASDVPLTEDAFRAGAKNSTAADYLRFSDLKTDTERAGRIPAEEATDWVVNPGQGISLFIKHRASSRSSTASLHDTAP
jgi:hypothetical protein